MCFLFWGQHIGSVLYAADMLELMLVEGAEQLGLISEPVLGRQL